MLDFNANRKFPAGFQRHSLKAAKIRIPAKKYFRASKNVPLVVYANIINCWLFAAFQQTSGEVWRILLRLNQNCRQKNRAGGRAGGALSANRLKNIS